MTPVEIPLPAPLWRRLAALAYDGLLYLALLMGGLVLALPFVAFFVADDAKTPLQNYQVLQAYGFLVGLAYFGFSWVRGGRTLGMKVWKLQVRRLNGMGLRWPTAVIRFTAGFGCIVLGLWAGQILGPAACGAALIAYLPCLLSERGRALPDYLAGTEVISG